VNAPAQPELGGSKVLLVPLGEEHLAKSLEWVNAPFIMATVLRVTPVTWDDQRRWFVGIKNDPTKFVYAIILKASGQHIGNTGLYGVDFFHRRGEFWIYIGDEDSRGKGAASESLRLIKDLAFKQLKLQRLYLHVGVDNLPARRLYTRNGFREEGVLRHHYIIDSKPVDIVVMSQLGHEYDD